METIIERQGGNSQALRDVNQTIKVLKGQITEDNRKIKELEHDISTTEANVSVRVVYINIYRSTQLKGNLLGHRMHLQAVMNRSRTS